MNSMEIIISIVIYNIYLISIIIIVLRMSWMAQWIKNPPANAGDTGDKGSSPG